MDPPYFGVWSWGYVAIKALGCALKLRKEQKRWKLHEQVMTQIEKVNKQYKAKANKNYTCLLYTSDAADE